MFLLTPITETEVIQVIKVLKKNSSVGLDETPTFLVKQCLCHFIKPLVHIYNVSFHTGTFPDKMKKANIKPLFKKEDRQDIQNYSPISLLSVFSKPLKKLMYKAGPKRYRTFAIIIMSLFHVVRQSIKSFT